MDNRPLNCRFRLRDEDKAYPRSSCQACGKSIVTGLGNECTIPTEFIEQSVEYMTETDVFLSIFIHWMERDKGTFREQHSLEQLLIMAKELQAKICGTSSKNSIASLPGK